MACSSNYTVLVAHGAIGLWAGNSVLRMKFVGADPAVKTTDRNINPLVM